MATLRQIKRRSEGIEKIRKVAKALEVVSATRLKRIEKTALKMRPYAEGLRRMMANVSARTKEKHPLMAQPAKTDIIGVVAITSDRGLCGGFNTNIFRTVMGSYQMNRIKLLTIGKKGKTYFGRKKSDLIGEYFDLDETRLGNVSSEIVKTVIDLYNSEKVKRIDLIYNKFRLHLLGKVSQLQILPVKPVKIEEGKGISTDYIYEPGAGEVLDRLIPEYIEVQIRQAWLESRASEEMARMVAMEYATENADELVDKLMLDYHKARQAVITREIIEVVSGMPA